jgi:hypothetical protein
VAAAAGAVGLAPAPSGKSARLVVTDAVSATRSASIAPSLDWVAPRHSFLTASVAIAPVRFGENWYEHLDGAKRPAPGKAASGSGRTERLAKQAAASPHKPGTATASAEAKTARAALTAKDVPWPAPLPERFAGSVAADTASPIILAYADPSPAAAYGAFDAMTDGASDDMVSDESADDENLSDEVPLPLARPRIKNESQAKPTADQPATDKPVTARQDDNDAEPEVTPARKLQRDKEQKLAFARPDDPSKDSEGGSWLGRLFGGNGRASAGDGVAVYDISAKKVYMPDGTTLEAHSGVGNMADDPRYVHVKMNGPTPPHTYRLKMREARFHGVEAIRMLPVNGKNLYGRGGFLTHSYLLRGRTKQSHGCVAFANYPKFLAAFKAGKVKTLVVVSGGGKGAAVRMAKNGTRA